MVATETMFAIAIGILYPWFFYKFIDYYTYDEILNKSCMLQNDYENELPQKYPFIHSNLGIDEKCQNKKTAYRDKREFTINVFLITVGILTLAGSGFINTPSTKLGLGLAGILCIFYATLFYWTKYKEFTKLIILGIALLVVVILSVRLYKLDNVADLFVPDYGKLDMNK